MKNFTTKIMALGMTLAFLTCGLTACRNASAAEPEKAPEVPAASEQEEQAHSNNEVHIDYYYNTLPYRVKNSP